MQNLIHQNFNKKKIFADMLVSVITPSFNQAEFLERTIQSVLNVNYPNLEYIIIDGGSTDGSVDIIKKYADRLTYWHSKPDKGQVDALNQGFKIAKGEIIHFLNADDLLTPDSIDSVVRCFEVNKQNSVVYGQCSVIDKNDEILFEPEGGNITKDFLVKTGMIPKIYQPACFFKRAYITRDYFVDPAFSLAFDYELLMYLFVTKKTTFYFLHKHLACYRRHNQSKSSKHRLMHYEQKLSIQEMYSKSNVLLWKWRKIMLVIAKLLGRYR